MDELFERSIKTLELPRVLELLAEQAVSDAAKARALELKPCVDEAEVRELQKETAAARMLIGANGSPSFCAIKDVENALARAERGGTLSMLELLRIAGVMRSAREVKNYRGDGGGENTALDPMFFSLRPNKGFEDRITASILDENEMADGASAELSDIRRHIRATSAKSRQILQKIISSQSYSKLLQENIITQRDGRFVVPVKAEHKSELPGLVHDVSSSGATLFVEPMAVVQANNELRELEAKEKKEIERILAELSAEAASRAEDIRWNWDVLTQLDLIFAKGELSWKMRASGPEIRSDGGIVLRRARHPLLDRDTAVPIDVELGIKFDTLFITGPNTGGKTVTLKTVGLLTLMTQCGLHIPAADGSGVSVFSRVLADIGDEQSIEQNLSTFSSHMVNIVQMLKAADDKTMVLFDELGAGTDPVEGAALAIAIVKYARARGSRIAATTHYAELKTYAMTTNGIENASCEFDVETLRPTYRLLIGIPGKSNAFAIASKLGISDEIIENAKAQMNAESVRFEDVLTKLESSRQALEKEKIEMERMRLEREADVKKAREFKEQMERARANARTKAETEARRILSDARAQADLVFDELDKMRRAQIKAESYQQINDARTEMMRSLNEAEEAMSSSSAVETNYRLPRPLRVGDTVELAKFGTRAEIRSISKDGALKLIAGNMKLTASSDEVRLVEDAPKKKPKPIGGGSPSFRVAPAKAEIDIRGMMTDEAEGVVDRFIDDAALGKLTQVTIIHGKGTGALRKSVHEQLKRHPAVKSYRLGVYGEGEDGVTVVELK
ncbi:MAG: endonuclease MutS2 [Oscillospiraceae bacterium]|nr:endonuclease MutS2 [Oscillospiraceae bacterium]